MTRTSGRVPLRDETVHHAGAVRWSDIDMYQHVNHATMVTILEEARVPFLAEPFADDFVTTGLLIAEVKVTTRGSFDSGIRLCR